VAEEGLPELLARVRAHLGGAAPLDTEVRAQLHTLVRDIEHTLHAGEAAGGAARNRLEALAVKFEVSHPALAETLREVMDALGKAGI